MPESPAARTPYEVLGVASTASQDELRRAYRQQARLTHPDLGGPVEKFRAVQLAWEKIGDPDSRARYDRGSQAESVAPPTARPAHARGRAESSTVRARSYGYPGGTARGHYLELIREWVGLGSPLTDPYDPSLVRSAPLGIRLWLSKALAEEATARIVADLGMGFTIWNGVAVRRGQPIDHVVLGPSGLFAVVSEDWGSPVRLLKGEVVGENVGEEQPLKQLSQSARSLAKSVGVTITGLIVIVPDDAVDEGISRVDRGKNEGALLVRRSLLAHLLRTGLVGVPAPGIGETMEVRARLQQSVTLVD